MIYKSLTLLDGSTMVGPWAVKTTEQGTAVFINGKDRTLVPLTSVCVAEPYDMDGDE